MCLNNDEEFIFIFDDNAELIVPKNHIIEISPTFYFKNINNDEQNSIKMPKYIKRNDLEEFLEIYKKYIFRLRQFNFDESFISMKLLLQGFSINISKLIQISELFENNSFSLLVIKDCILNENNESENINSSNHRMNFDNALMLLNLSYKKLKEINSVEKTNMFNNIKNNSDTDLEITWLDLFIKSLEMIGNNLDYYFKNNTSDKVTSNKLWSFDRKIIDELYEKFSFNFILKDTIINKDEIELESDMSINCIHLKELTEIINFLIKKRNQNDFFYLLSNEFMNIVSEDNINEINSLPNPTFLLKINLNDLNDYYEEYPINNLFNLNENMKLVIIVYYKKNEDSFNISLKLSKDKKDKTISGFDIFTFLSLALVEEIDNKQINVKSLFNNKSMYDILKIQNFKKILKTKRQEKSVLDNYLTIKLYLKPCFLYTLLCNYLFYNLENSYDNKNINKISKNLLSILIQKKYLTNNENKSLKNIDDNKIVICLINWLNDEMNINEDISSIIKTIRWEYVSLTLIFEFLIKYSNNIESEDIELIFSKSLSKILKKFEGDINLLSKEITHSLILSSKKLNYISIFCENKKIKKFNLYELLNKQRNISLQLNERNNNNSFSNKININKRSRNYYTIDKNKNEITFNPKHHTSSKDNFNYTVKEENRINKKEKIINNISPIEKNKHLKNIKNNISFLNHSGICYNNYFTDCNNNFNINIFKTNKSNNNNQKKNLSQSNKKRKVIISKIKINNYNNKKINPNNININKSNVNNKQNRKYITNTPDSFSPKIDLNKLNTNNIFNKTINLKNIKMIDNNLIKDKCERSKNKSSKINKYKSKLSELKNKSFINEINYKKYMIQKNCNENNENDNSKKKDKNKVNISLLNELLKLNKKTKK